MRTDLIDGFLKETSIVLLYAIPISLLVHFLELIHWDASFLILFIEILFCVNILIREDRETIDCHIHVLAIRLATLLGWFILGRTAKHYLFEYVKVSDDSEEENFYLTHLSQFLEVYLSFIILLSKFRAILFMVIGVIYLIALLISHFLPI